MAWNSTRAKISVPVLPLKDDNKLTATYENENGNGDVVDGEGERNTRRWSMASTNGTSLSLDSGKYSNSSASASTASFGVPQTPLTDAPPSPSPSPSPIRTTASHSPSSQSQYHPYSASTPADSTGRITARSHFSPHLGPPQPQSQPQTPSEIYQPAPAAVIAANSDPQSVRDKLLPEDDHVLFLQTHHRQQLHGHSQTHQLQAFQSQSLQSLQVAVDHRQREPSSTVNVMAVPPFYSQRSKVLKIFNPELSTNDNHSIDANTSNINTNQFATATNGTNPLGALFHPAHHPRSLWTLASHGYHSSHSFQYNLHSFPSNSPSHSQPCSDSPSAHLALLTSTSTSTSENRHQHQLELPHQEQERSSSIPSPHSISNRVPFIWAIFDSHEQALSALKALPPSMVELAVEDDLRPYSKLRHVDMNTLGKAATPTGVTSTTTNAIAAWDTLIAQVASNASEGTAAGCATALTVTASTASSTASSTVSSKSCTSAVQTNTSGATTTGNRGAIGAVGGSGSANVGGNCNPPNGLDRKLILPQHLPSNSDILTRSDGNANANTDADADGNTPSTSTPTSGFNGLNIVTVSASPVTVTNPAAANVNERDRHVTSSSASDQTQNPSFGLAANYGSHAYGHGHSHDDIHAKLVYNFNRMNFHAPYESHNKSAYEADMPLEPFEPFESLQSFSPFGFFVSRDQENERGGHYGMEGGYGHSGNDINVREPPASAPTPTSATIITTLATSPSRDSGQGLKHGANSPANSSNNSHNGHVNGIIKVPNNISVPAAAEKDILMSRNDGRNAPTTIDSPTPSSSLSSSSPAPASAPVSGPGPTADLSTSSTHPRHSNYSITDSEPDLEESTNTGAGGWALEETPVPRPFAPVPLSVSYSDTKETQRSISGPSPGSTLSPRSHLYPYSTSHSSPIALPIEANPEIASMPPAYRRPSLLAQGHNGNSDNNLEMGLGMVHSSKNIASDDAPGALPDVVIFGSGTSTGNMLQSPLYGRLHARQTHRQLQPSGSVESQPSVDMDVEAQSEVGGSGTGTINRAIDRVKIKTFGSLNEVNNATSTSQSSIPQEDPEETTTPRKEGEATPARVPSVHSLASLSSILSVPSVPAAAVSERIGQLEHLEVEAHMKVTQTTDRGVSTLFSLPPNPKPNLISSHSQLRSPVSCQSSQTSHTHQSQNLAYPTRTESGQPLSSFLCADGTDVTSDSDSNTASRAPQIPSHSDLSELGVKKPAAAVELGLRSDPLTPGDKTLPWGLQMVHDPLKGSQGRSPTYSTSSPVKTMGSGLTFGMGVKSSDRQEQDAMTGIQESSTFAANLSSNVKLASSSQFLRDSDPYKSATTGNHAIGGNGFSYSAPPPATFRIGDWMCPVSGCGAHNFGRNMNCISCGSARGSIISPFAFQPFGTNQLTNNSIGSSASLSGIYGTNLNLGNLAMGMGMPNSDGNSFSHGAKRVAAQEHLQQQSRLNGGVPLIPRLAALNINAFTQEHGGSSDGLGMHTSSVQALGGINEVAAIQEAIKAHQAQTAQTTQGPAQSLTRPSFPNNLRTSHPNINPNANANMNGNVKTMANTTGNANGGRSEFSSSLFSSQPPLLIPTTLGNSPPTPMSRPPVAAPAHLLNHQRGINNVGRNAPFNPLFPGVHGGLIHEQGQGGMTTVDLLRSPATSTAIPGLPNGLPSLAAHINASSKVPQLVNPSPLSTQAGMLQQSLLANQLLANSSLLANPSLLANAPILTPSGRTIAQGGRVQNISRDDLNPVMMFWPDNEPFPETCQIRPPTALLLAMGGISGPPPPILNTGNKGPIDAQPGDWTCGKCDYLNWRRRRVCANCFPHAEGNSEGTKSNNNVDTHERLALLAGVLLQQQQAQQAQQAVLIASQQQQQQQQQRQAAFAAMNASQREYLNGGADRAFAAKFSLKSPPPYPTGQHHHVSQVGSNRPPRLTNLETPSLSGHSSEMFFRERLPALHQNHDFEAGKHNFSPHNAYLYNQKIGRNASPPAPSPSFSTASSKSFPKYAEEPTPSPLPLLPSFLHAVVGDVYVSESSSSSVQDSHSRSPSPSPSPPSSISTSSFFALGPDRARVQHRRLGLGFTATSSPIDTGADRSPHERAMDPPFSHGSSRPFHQQGSTLQRSSPYNSSIWSLNYSNDAMENGMQHA